MKAPLYAGRLSVCGNGDSCKAKWNSYGTITIRVTKCDLKWACDIENCNIENNYLLYILI